MQKKNILILNLFLSSQLLFAQNNWNQYRGNSANTAFIQYESGSILNPEIGWVSELNSEIVASPILTDSLVIVAAENNIYLLNRSDGKEVWKFEASGDIWATPIILNNKLYVTSLGGYLYIIDIKTRELIDKLWLSQYDENTYPEYTYIKSGLKSDEQQVYVMAESHILALDIKTNNVNWKTEIRFGDTWSSPALDENFIYHLGDFELYVVRKQDGVIVHKERIGTANINSPSLYKNNIIFNSRDGDLYTYDLINRSYKKNIETSVETVNSTSLFNNIAYFGNSNGQIYSYDILNEEIMWTLDSHEPILSSSIIVNSVVIFSTKKGNLLGINKDSGNIEWRYSLKSGIKTSSPSYSNGEIYIADTLGNVYLIKEKTMLNKHLK